LAWHCFCYCSDLRIQDAVVVAVAVAVESTSFVSFFLCTFKLWWHKDNYGLLGLSARFRSICLIFEVQQLFFGKVTGCLCLWLFLLMLVR
jgi:hypothetical protein